ncbi:maltokinase N-terminal cap-like domain-containing protein [Microbacterium sp.]|uniref:maltokinase N-terminal cap-like domain-containing protein n=1 Tax=Microbacterium sp. TaxID=51671 RepID=UPI003C716AED
MSSTLAALTAWMPRQRWYTTTDGIPRLRILADRPFSGATAPWGRENPPQVARHSHQHVDSDDPGTQVRILIVVDDAPQRPIVYQVPLVMRAAADVTGMASFIGVTDAGRALVDGPHDPAYTAALWRQLESGDEATAEVLSGEQSNTSIIFRPDHGTPVICKVFRRLHSGLNPEIELQSALAAAGSAHVPAVVGSVDGQWHSATTDDVESGSLAFAQEFFPGVADAWRVALSAASAGADFTDESDALGRATAEVHLDLARLLPTPPADDDARAALAGSWRRRLAIALTEVPQLARHRHAIERTYRAAMATEWPALQRVHGDFHLGQVLQVPGRGWVLLDFEGEPMRPIDERRAPDLALRDIAGMLRSFDYVAGSLAQADTRARAGADAWAAAARDAFLRGYRAASGAAASGPLLDALELDKAVYESLYEARHRPAWLAIPLAAISRLVDR